MEKTLWRIADGDIKYTYTHPLNGEIELNEFIEYGKDNALVYVQCGKAWKDMIGNILWFENLKGQEQMTSQRLVNDYKARQQTYIANRR